MKRGVKTYHDGQYHAEEDQGRGHEKKKLEGSLSKLLQEKTL
jgi:hypothetical protein